MKVKDILEDARIRLNENKIEEATNKARRLLAFVLNEKKEYLITHTEQELSYEQEELYKKYIEEIIDGRPIQYILGYQEFMGINFIVNENVLIPQPDTETLVEKTIEVAKLYQQPKILDMCTGSGAIAVALAKFLPQANISASDISKEALEVAKLNDTYSKINFIHSDMFENIEEKFNIIVSNPPYIKSSVIGTLSKEVQNEPHIALDGGKDGLDFYRIIIDQAHNYLNSKGSLCLEIGEEQKKEIIDLLNKNENYEDIQTCKDMAGNDRVIISRIK